LRRIEWVFVFLFIASGLYCLAIPAGMPTFSVPLPDWFYRFQPYFRPFVWGLIVIGVTVSLWSIWGNKRK
jgi:hypothetical protein